MAIIEAITLCKGNSYIRIFTFTSIIKYRPYVCIIVSSTGCSFLVILFKHQEIMCEMYDLDLFCCFIKSLVVNSKLMLKYNFLLSFSLSSFVQQCNSFGAWPAVRIHPRTPFCHHIFLLRILNHCIHATLQKFLTLTVKLGCLFSQERIQI